MALELTWKDYAIAGLTVSLVLTLLWNSSLRTSVEEYKTASETTSQELFKLKTQIAKHTESITETTKLPDGTTTTKTIKITDSTKVLQESADKKNTSKTETSTKIVKADKSRYLLQALYDINSTEGMIQRVTPVFGARLGDLPVFGLVSGKMSENGIIYSAGVGAEW